MAELRWGAATDSGRVRDENEDTFVAEPMVFGVADGMGGHQAGEVASELAADTLRERLGAGAANVDVVVAAVLEANAAIFQAAHDNAAQQRHGHHVDRAGRAAGQRRASPSSSRSSTSATAAPTCCATAS